MCKACNLNINTTDEANWVISKSFENIASLVQYNIRDLKIPRSWSTGRTPCFFVLFFHIWYMTSHHATQKPSHFSGVITAVMGTGNLPISVHQKQVHVS